MSLRKLCLIALWLIEEAYSHDHQSHSFATWENVSAAPIDAILWLHIFIQTVTWMFIFPVGIVLGVSFLTTFIRSRWHVPVQTGGIGLAITAHFLGHAHGGRQFRSNSHGDIAKLLTIWLAVQALCGTYLKLHIKHKYEARIRPAVVAVHAILGIGMPIVAWVQVVLGGFTAVGLCYGNNAGECLARTLSGSSMICAGILLLAPFQTCEVSGQTAAQVSRLPVVRAGFILAVGSTVLFVDWIYQNPTGRSFLDLGGIYLIWIFAVALILILDRTLTSHSRVNSIPGIFLIIIGWFVALRQRYSAISTLYGALGFCMQAAGFSRLISAAVETQFWATSQIICFWVRFLSSYFLTASGFLFMGTTNEQLELLSKAKMPAPAFVLLLQCAAFLLLGSISLLSFVFMQRSVSVPGEYEQPSVFEETPLDQMQGKDYETDMNHLPLADVFRLEDI